MHTVDTHMTQTQIYKWNLYSLKLFRCLMWMMMWDVLLLHRSVSSYLGKCLVVYNLPHFSYGIFLGWMMIIFALFLSPVLCRSAHIWTLIRFERNNSKWLRRLTLFTLFKQSKSFWTPFYWFSIVYNYWYFIE